MQQLLYGIESLEKFLKRNIHSICFICKVDLFLLDQSQFNDCSQSKLQHIFISMIYFDFDCSMCFLF